MDEQTVGILTWSNVGDKLVEVVKLIKAKGEGMPTPEECGLDNKLIGPDGLTNYSWAMREAYKLCGYVSIG